MVYFTRVKQQPQSSMKTMMTMAGVRMYEVDHLSFVGPATLAVVVRKGYGATLVQLPTGRLKVVHPPDCRDCSVGRSTWRPNADGGHIPEVEGADDSCISPGAGKEGDNDAACSSFYVLLEKEVVGEQWGLPPTQGNMEDMSEGGLTKGDEGKEEGTGKGVDHSSTFRHFLSWACL
jgi:hypothetical protein